MQEVARWDVALLDGNGNIVDMSLPETLWEVLSLSLSLGVTKIAKRMQKGLIAFWWFWLGFAPSMLPLWLRNPGLLADAWWGRTLWSLRPLLLSWEGA